MNKNTRAIRIKIRKAGKKGEDLASISIPSRDYVKASSRSAGMTTKLFPTARVKGDGVNSVNKRRNSCQRVYTNMGENRCSTSLTCHEPFLRNEPMRGKGHGYIEYRRGNVSA